MEDCIYQLLHLEHFPFCSWSNSSAWKTKGQMLPSVSRRAVWPGSSELWRGSPGGTGPGLRWSWSSLLPHMMGILWAASELIQGCHWDQLLNPLVVQFGLSSVLLQSPQCVKKHESGTTLAVEEKKVEAELCLAHNRCLNVESVNVCVLAQPSRWLY